MAIRVAFNATPLLSPLTGIGNYIVELGAALAATGDVDAYSFYRYRWRHESPQRPADSGGSLPPLVERIKPWLPLKGLLRHAVREFGFARGLRKHAIEVYHEQNYIPLGYGAPVVITIHDLSWIRYPETHPVDRVRWLERGLPRAIERAAAILVDSDFVRNEVVATFGIAEERVRTAHLGVSAAFHPRTGVETAATLRAMGLTHGGYLLTVGTIEPRKNLAHTLEAFAQLPLALRERYPLVVAGASGWYASDMVARLRQLESQGQVRFLGHVAGAQLPDLYAGAVLFVFPSLYEGFGLPPLEAMASGVPVLVSDRASLPEVIGNAGRTIDPERPDNTATILVSLLEDPAARAVLAGRGIERAAGFTWAACADVARTVYHAVA